MAQAYFLIRELDAAQALYGDVVTLRADTVRLLQRRFEEGDIAELGLARARSELATARSESLGLARQRAVAADLIGLIETRLGCGPAPRIRAVHLAWSSDATHRSDRLSEQPTLIGAGELLRPGEIVLALGNLLWFVFAGFGALTLEGGLVLVDELLRSNVAQVKADVQ